MILPVTNSAEFKVNMNSTKASVIGKPTYVQNGTLTNFCSLLMISSKNKSQGRFGFSLTSRQGPLKKQHAGVLLSLKTSLDLSRETMT